MRKVFNLNCKFVAGFDVQIMAVRFIVPSRSKLVENYLVVNCELCVVDPTGYALGVVIRIANGDAHKPQEKLTVSSGFSDKLQFFGVRLKQVRTTEILSKSCTV